MSYTPRPLPEGFLARPIAHRGLHDAARGIIENTAPAFAAALAAGYAIECDVLPSREGEAMVFHDATLKRLTTATGPVRAYGTAALRALPFRQGTHGMDTLAALLRQVAGRVPLVVEVKAAFDGSAPLAARLAMLAAIYHGPLMFKSFDPHQLIALRAAGVRQPLGIVAMRDLSRIASIAHLDPATLSSLETLAHAGQSQPDFLSWNIGQLPALQPPGQQLPVMGWTVRDAATAQRIASQVDQIVFEGFRPTFAA